MSLCRCARPRLRCPTLPYYGSVHAFRSNPRIAASGSPRHAYPDPKNTKSDLNVESVLQDISWTQIKLKWLIHHYRGQTSYDQSIYTYPPLDEVIRNTAKRSVNDAHPRVTAAVQAHLGAKLARPIFKDEGKLKWVRNYHETIIKGNWTRKGCYDGGAPFYPLFRAYRHASFMFDSREELYTSFFVDYIPQGILQGPYIVLEKLSHKDREALDEIIKMIHLRRRTEAGPLTFIDLAWQMGGLKHDMRKWKTRKAWFWFIWLGLLFEGGARLIGLILSP